MLGTFSWSVKSLLTYRPLQRLRASYMSCLDFLPMDTTNFLLALLSHFMRMHCIALLTWSWSPPTAATFFRPFLPSIRKADATFPISCSIAFGKCDGGCGCCGAESACMSACLRSLSHPSISLSILFPPPSASPSTESWSDWRAKFQEFSLPYWVKQSTHVSYTAFDMA